MRNIFACLVHEAPDCALDLVRNLRHLDQDSAVLLYNGSNDRQLLEPAADLERAGALLHPRPNPVRWGRAHGFALDCMAFALAELPFSTLTIVDSEQLLLRPGYSAAIADALAGAPDVGMLGSLAEPPDPDSGNPPVASARREQALWQSYLRRFGAGPAQFPRWSFWPATVFTADAARALVELWSRDATLREHVARSHMLSTEEIVLPTLVGLLGFRVAAGPSNPRYLRFRARFGWRDLHRATHDPTAFWLHPALRRFADPARATVRALHNNYAGPNTQPPLRPPLPAAPPLVSCIMATHNRRHFVPAALAHFQRQDYRNRELVVVDDGDDPIGDLLPNDQRIVYIRLDTRLPVSEKRNLACRAARGALLLVWDDDDWQASWRVGYQAAHLLAAGADVCGAARLYAHDTRAGQGWVYIYPPDERAWVAGSTLCFIRATWERSPFPPINPGSDTRFLWASPPRRILPLPDASFQVALIHGANSTRGNFATSHWYAAPPATWAPQKSSQFGG